MRVTVRVFVEQEQAHNIRDEATSSDDHDDLRVANFWCLDEALDSLHEDGAAECEQKHAIHQRAENFCTVPPVGILVRRVVLGELNGIERHNQAQHVIEHVEAISDERQ